MNKMGKSSKATDSQVKPREKVQVGQTPTKPFPCTTPLFEGALRECALQLPAHMLLHPITDHRAFCYSLVCGTLELTVWGARS